VARRCSSAVGTVAVVVHCSRAVAVASIKVPLPCVYIKATNASFNLCDSLKIKSVKIISGSNPIHFRTYIQQRNRRDVTRKLEDENWVGRPELEDDIEFFFTTKCLKVGGFWPPY
jgi:hypothetical protein